MYTFSLQRNVGTKLLCLVFVHTHAHTHTLSHIHTLVYIILYIILCTHFLCNDTLVRGINTHTQRRRLCKTDVCVRGGGDSRIFKSAVDPAAQILGVKREVVGHPHWIPHKILQYIRFILSATKAEKQPLVDVSACGVACQRPGLHLYSSCAQPVCDAAPHQHFTNLPWFAFRNGR